MTPLLIGLALVAAPSDPDIGAQFAAEFGASDVACSTTGRTICYGMDEGGVIGAEYVDGAFVVPDFGVVVTTPPTDEPRLPAASSSFGPGMWLVGPDIAPGTYRAITEDDGSFALCAWSRLSGVSGDSDDRISYESVYDGGVQVLTEILPTDYAFESHGCGTWTPV